jgi:hypothetical protein
MTTTAARRILESVSEIALSAPDSSRERHATVDSPIGAITIRFSPRNGKMVQHRSVGFRRRRACVVKTWELNGKRIAEEKLVSALIAE